MLYHLLHGWNCISVRMLVLAGNWVVINSYVTVGLFNCCQMEVYIDMIVPVVEEWYERFMEVMNTEVQIDESGSLDFLPSTVGSYLVVLLGVFCFSVVWSIVLAQFQKPKQRKRVVHPKSKSRATKNAPAKKAERCTSGMLSSIEETDIPTQTEISEDSFSVDSELTETETETEYSEFYNDYADESTIEESLHNETGEFRDEDQETSLEADDISESCLTSTPKLKNEWDYNHRPLFKGILDEESTKENCEEQENKENLQQHFRSQFTPKRTKSKGKPQATIPLKSLPILSSKNAPLGIIAQ